LIGLSETIRDQSKVIAAYFGASVRSIASFAARLGDDRQRRLVMRLFGVVAITVPSNVATMRGRSGRPGYYSELPPRSPLSRLSLSDIDAELEKLVMNPWCAS
jgi:hypothetical protein